MKKHGLSIASSHKYGDKLRQSISQPNLSVGDQVYIMKEGTKKGKKAVVEKPNWNRMVKVKLGDETLSYLPEELSIVEAAGVSKAPPYNEGDPWLTYEPLTTVSLSFKDDVRDQDNERIMSLTEVWPGLNWKIIPLNGAYERQRDERQRDVIINGRLVFKLHQKYQPHHQNAKQFEFFLYFSLSFRAKYEVRLHCDYIVIIL